MSEALSPLDNPELLAAICAGSPAAPDMPVPFEADTFLVGTEVIWKGFVEDMPRLFGSLVLGERVELFREPDNMYDGHAIAVRTAEGEMLGYVPDRYNLILSRLMDSGRSLYANVRAMEFTEPDSYRLVIKIYMADGKPVSRA